MSDKIVLNYVNLDVTERLRDHAFAVEWVKILEEEIDCLHSASKWRPIETAPKDGTHIILFWPFITQGGFVTAGRWFNPHDLTSAGYWYSDYVHDGVTPPTHWLPLPSPPEGET